MELVGENENVGEVVAGGGGAYSGGGENELGGGGGVPMITVGVSLPLRIGGGGGRYIRTGGADSLVGGERRASCDPFSFSLELLRDNLDIMRCRRPDLLFEDTSDTILALMIGGSFSVGGPSSRKSMRSLAVFEM